MLEMAGYEPWDGDTRTYYTTPQPPPDQANPFLEFDPQMCIICTPCLPPCPTATLMEHPNKWSATQTERWTATTCTQCSVGCSISLGAKRGRGVIVRPDTTANPVSRDQLCVRGRFHYNAVKDT